MILDFVEGTGAFTLTIPRNEGGLVREIMEKEGLDYSLTASTAEKAVLFTRSEYAAAPFFESATERAKQKLLSLQAEIDASWAIDTSFQPKCPASLEPWGFQKAGVEYALRRKHTLFADVPGLGKTVEAILLANELGSRRVLVICPAAIRLQWRTMIHRWSTMSWRENFIDVILKGSHGVGRYAAWTVISYDLARVSGIGEALSAIDWDLLILDEAHYLKDINSQRSRAIFGGGSTRTFHAIAERTQHIAALTGTPLPNRPREAYVMARGLAFDSIDFLSEEAFRMRFNPSQRGENQATGQVYTEERTGRHGELQARLRANFMVRREKHGPRGVMGQLHMPEFDIVRVEEDAAVKGALRAERLLDIDPENLPGPDDPIAGQVATVRRMMGVAIAPHAAAYCKVLLDGGEEKLVVFGHHVEVLDILQKAFAPYGVVRIDGSVPPNRRQALVDRFRLDQRVRVFLANLLAGGTGVDGLQEVASHVVIAEPDWTPGNNQQAVDRLDRGGQRDKVMADFIVAPGSFSEKVLGAALKKLDTVHRALDHRRGYI